MNTRPDDFSVSGLREIDQALSTLPEKLQRNVMRAALRAGAKQIAQQAKQDAPRKTGKLAESVRVSSRIRYGMPEASIKAGGKVKGKNVWYAVMVEKGTVPHEIAVKKGTMSLFINGKPAGKSVQHPGFAARPFMRPAMNAKAKDATQRTAEFIRDKLKTKFGIEVADPEPEDKE